MGTFEKMILDFINVLGKMRVDYVIIGGVAVSSWGTPRKLPLSSCSVQRILLHTSCEGF
jgi:hypothetical protein